MPNIVISYNRKSEAVARILADDIEKLGKTVWFDQELSGGQEWWDQILDRIRRCDIFVFVLSPDGLRSTACKREYRYAAALGKPILPVLIADGVSPNSLPLQLSKIQYVDYRNRDSEAALLLGRAFANLPPTEPLPDPLPAPPEVPISYLNSLWEEIEDDSNELSPERQSFLVLELKRSLTDPETRKDGLELLEKLRRRSDLFANTAGEIDELSEKVRESERQTVDTAAGSQGSKNETQMEAVNLEALNPIDAGVHARGYLFGKSLSVFVGPFLIILALFGIYLMLGERLGSYVFGAGEDPEFKQKRERVKIDTLELVKRTFLAADSQIAFITAPNNICNNHKDPRELKVCKAKEDSIGESFIKARQDWNIEKNNTAALLKIYYKGDAAIMEKWGAVEESMNSYLTCSKKCWSSPSSECAKCPDQKSNFEKSRDVLFEQLTNFSGSDGK